jgi:hypothetical protein
VEINRYVYGINNPVRYMDASGMAVFGEKGLLQKIKLVAQKGYQAFTNALKDDFRKGFVGGVAGYLVGKLILKIFQKPNEKYSALDFVSDTADFFIAGLTGALIEIMNSKIPEFPNFEQSAKFIGVAGFATGQVGTLITTPISAIKDWLVTPIAYEETDESFIELGLDIVIGAVFSAGAGISNGASLSLSKKYKFTGLSAFLSLTIFTLIDGGLGAGQVGLDNRISPPKFSSGS